MFLSSMGSTSAAEGRGLSWPEWLVKAKFHYAIQVADLVADL